MSFDPVEDKIDLKSRTLRTGHENVAVSGEIQFSRPQIGDNGIDDAFAIGFYVADSEQRFVGIGYQKILLARMT